MSDLAKVQIAQLHYVEELSKQDIATRLGMSRFKVARLLAQARTDGLVRIEIDEPLPVDAPAGRALERAFGLDLAVVTTEPGMLARAGAAWLPEWLGDGRVLGVGWGRTLAALAAALDPRPELRADVVQVCGAIAGLAAGTTSMEVALRLAEKLGGDAAVLAAPAVASRRARDELLANAAVAPTVARWADLDLVLAGIGGHLPGAPRTAVGHLLVHSFDADGGLLRRASHRAGDRDRRGPAARDAGDGRRRRRGQAHRGARGAAVRPAGRPRLRRRHRGPRARGMSAALVTGAGGGIGGAVCAALAAAGMQVLGVDRATVALDGVRGHTAELTDEAQVAGAIAAAEAAFGRLDVVVNCAGGSGRRAGDGPVDAIPRAGWDATLETNLTSVFLVCKHAVPALRRAGGGAIVNLASVLGLVGGDRDFATHAYAAVQGRDRVADARDGRHLRARGDRLQRRLPGPDRDADERAGPGRPGDPRPARRAAAADRGLRAPGGRRRRGRVPRRSRRPLHDRRGADRRRRLDGAVTRLLGLDLGGSQIKGCVVEDDRVVGSAAVDTASADGPEAVLRRVVALGRELARRARRAGRGGARPARALRRRRRGRAAAEPRGGLGRPADRRGPWRTGSGSRSR